MKAGWQLCKLGDLTDLITKGTTPTSIGYEFTDNGVNFIKVESIKDNGDFIEEKLASISEGCHQALARSQIKEGDILFSIAGALGRTAIVPASLLPANTNQALAIIRLKKSEDIFPRFIYTALGTGFLLEQIEKFKGGVAQQNLSLAQVKDFQLTIPPIQEQQRIVAILDQAFEGIAKARANAEQNLQNARALFESHLQSIFTQRGEGWQLLPLSRLTERITKGSSPKWQGIKYVESAGVLFVTSENVGEYEMLLNHPKFVEDKFNLKEKKSILSKGDVLTNIVGASIGRTAIFESTEVANINQAVCLIRCEPTLLNNAYLVYLLNSPVFKTILHDNEVDNARANLSLGFFSNLEIPFPNIEKQKSIVQELNLFRKETQRLEALYQRKIACLDELKKSLLQQAFAGEL